MNYIKYNRTFVMLEQQSDTFALKAGPVKGYLKVETGNNKGALRCALQNCKPYDQGEYIYKLILFGKKGGRTIHTVIGELLVNRQGNGETYFRFHPLDMDGRGTRYDEYTVAIIAAMSTFHQEESLHPVLKGNMNTEDGERENETKERQTRERLNRERETREKETREKETRERQDRNSSNAAAAEKPAFKPKSSPEKKKTFNHFYNLFILLTCSQTGRNGEYFDDVSPFDDQTDKTGARWKKIINIATLPVVSPGAHYLATRYHHYLFGIKADDRGNPMKYFFGVPGRFLEEEQPDGGQSGFIHWQPIRRLEQMEDGEIRQKNSSYGYWIVAVDAYTGDIESV